jgi:hypothetical protein
VVRLVAATKNDGLLAGRTLVPGDIYQVIGTGSSGYTGDNGPAGLAELRIPTGLVVGPGEVYVEDSGNSVIREVAVPSSPATTTTTSTGPKPPARPVLARLSAGAGPKAGGTRVTLTGSGFTDVKAVYFGTKKARSFKVVSKTEIIATSPTGTGTVYVTVRTTVGTSAKTNADKFAYGRKR